MKISLLTKYIVSYLIVVVSALAVLNTVGAHRVFSGIINDRTKALEKEAGVIADSYLEDYYSGNKPLRDVYKELLVVDAYSDARIMIVSNDGEVLSDTRGYATAIKENRMKLPESLLEKDSVDDFKDFIRERQEKVQQEQRDADALNKMLV